MLNIQINKNKLNKFLMSFNIKVNDYEPYIISLLHHELNKSKRSLTNLQKNQEYLLKENQRFEYFGDTIYNFCINSYLFDLEIEESQKLIIKQMNEIKEQFICGKFQARLAKDLKLLEFITIPVNTKLKLTDEIYEDIFESFITAIYIDQGLEKTKNFINQIVFKDRPIIINNKQCVLEKQNNKPIRNKFNLNNSEINKFNKIIDDFEKQPAQTLNDIYNFLKIKKKKQGKLVPIKQLITYKNKSNKTILIVNDVEFQSGKNKKEAIINTIKSNKELLLQTIYQNM